MMRWETLVGLSECEKASIVPRNTRAETAMKQRRETRARGLRKRTVWCASFSYIMVIRDGPEEGVLRQACQNGQDFSRFEHIATMKAVNRCCFSSSYCSRGRRARPSLIASPTRNPVAYSESGSSRIRFTADLASHSRAFCRNSAAVCRASFSFIRI